MAAGYETIPANVSGYEIRGANATRRQVVERQIERSKLMNSRSVNDMLDSVRLAEENLSELGVFKEVRPIIDVDPNHRGSASSYRIIFDLTEGGRVTGGLFVNAEASKVLDSNTKPYASTALKIRNMTGRADALSCSVDTGFDAHRVNVEYTAFPQADITKRIRVGAYKTDTQHPMSRFNQSEVAVFSELNWKLNKLWSTLLRAESGARQMIASERKTPAAVRWNEGFSNKTALSLSLTRDSIEKMLESGSLFRSTLEVAGFGGDVSHLKSETEARKYFKLPEAWFGRNSDFLSFGYGGKCGFIQPKGTSTSTLICDRFFIGGPTSVRGFEPLSLGNVRKECALGLHSYWIFGGHVYSKLPLIKADAAAFTDIFRLQAFVSAAGSFDDGGVADEGTRLVSGCGLLMQASHRIRVELNYIWVHRRATQDKIAPGIQLGLGFDFL